MARNLDVVAASFKLVKHVGIRIGDCMKPLEANLDSVEGKRLVLCVYFNWH